MKNRSARNRARFVALLLVTLIAAPLVMVSDTAADEMTTGLYKLSDHEHWRFRYDGYDVYVFGWARNAHHDKQPFGDLEKIYYYCTSISVAKRGGSPDVQVSSWGDEDTVIIGIQHQRPPISVIKQYLIRNNVNPHVTDANIRPLGVFGVEAKHHRASRAYRNESMNGVDFDRITSVKLLFPSGDGERFREYFLNGSEQIEFAYLVLRGASSIASINIRGRDVKNTKTFRQIEGPANRNYVTSGQAFDMAGEVISDLTVHGYIEGDVGDQLTRMREDLFKKFVDYRRKVELDWSKIDRLHPYLADLSSDRFKSDVARQLASDSKNLSKRDFCHKWKNEVERRLDNHRKINGDATLSVLGLFSVGGKGGYDKDTKSHIRNLINREDCGKSVFEKNFSYSFNGEIYTPRAIYVHDLLTENINRQINESVITVKMRQKYDSVEIPIRL
ncbi:MAG: hypothetical protein P9L99_06245 [Candidatus Lernaella stagnicola]|nr:hypothetical protein [Candidatus Lernaella stagnicola]